MSQFVFSNTTTAYFGKEKLCNLVNEISHYGRNVFVVTGGSSADKSGALSAVTGYLNKAAESVVYFSGIRPNPVSSQINEGIKRCREEKCDLILAIGGGSVMDSAKAVSAGVNSKTDDIWDIVTHKTAILDPLPVITVPTTASTGSEMNSGAVITNPVTKQKYGFGAPSLQPVAAFYVPEFTFSLTQYQTACGCADIISHIIDSGYITALKPMEMLHSVQTQVLRTVFKYATVAVNDGYHQEARENLMWAASWALNGFMYENLNQEPALHIIEHQLSAEYDITHGHGIAVLLVSWLRYILDEKTAPAIAEFGIRTMDIPSAGDVMKDAEAAVNGLELFLTDSLKLDICLSHLCDYKNDIDALASKICQGRTIRGIRTLDEKDVCAILKMCE